MTAGIRPDAASELTAPVYGMTWGWTGVRGTWATPAAATAGNDDYCVFGTPAAEFLSREFGSRLAAAPADPITATPARTDHP